MNSFDQDRYLALAEDRIARGEQWVSRQLALIERLRDSGLPTDTAEDTLAAMEATLRQFYEQRNTLLSVAK
jgi:hypothetical protein